jgi:tetratricopeptide (TPR) repeat protein
VSVLEIDYEGQPLRGLVAWCRDERGEEHEVALADVVFGEATAGALHVGAYRRWMGLEPLAAAPPEHRQHKAEPEDIEPGRPVELVVLGVKERAARCRLLGADRVLTLRARGLWELVPGQIIVVNPRKQWRYGGHPYLSGEILSARIDVPALELVPLKLADWGTWDPAEHYWGEPDEPREPWELEVFERGPRPEYEMEQVLPGASDDNWDTDPIIESNELKHSEQVAEARKLLHVTAAADLRCLDAHAHLGHLAFDHDPEEALLHYEIGVRIGQLSLGPDFDGVLPWGLIDNRPFLRCMHGYGLCLWRLGRIDEAAEVFRRILWMNPADNQGIRFLQLDLAAGRSWEECEGQDEERSTEEPTRESVRQLLISATDDLDEVQDRVLSMGPSTIPELLDVLSDDDLFQDDGPGEGWAPIHAAKLLLRFGDAAPVEALLDRLLGLCDESLVAETIRLGLPELGEPVLGPALARAESVTEPEQREELVYLLGALADQAGTKDPRGFAFLLGVLDESTDAAAGALADYGDPAAIAPLAEMLDRQRPEGEDGAFAGQTVIELAAAIQHLGGQLSASQQLELDAVRAARRSWAASLMGAFSDAPIEKATLPRRSSAADRKKRKSKRKASKRSRRKNR